MDNSEMRQAGCALAQRRQCFAIALEHIQGVAHVSKPTGILKRIKAQIRFEHRDGSCRFSGEHQAEAEARISEIGIQRPGSFEFGYCRLMLTLEQQNPAKVRVSKRQIWIEPHGLLGELVR